MKSGVQGRVLLIEGTVNGNRFFEGIVTYWRDTYGHVLAVAVADDFETVTVPWRNVAVVVTEASERGGTADAPA